MFSRDHGRAALQWPYIASLPFLLVALVISPFFTGTDTFWFGPPLFCVYAMAACLWMPGLKSGWNLPRSETAGWILAFALYCWVSVIWSKAPFISILFAFIVTSLPLLFFILITAPQPRLAVRLHGVALFVVLAGFALWALVQFFFMYEKYGPRIHHPMLSPNSLAALFMIGLFFALALLMRARERKNILISYALVLLMMMALVTTQSRGGMIFTGVALGVYLLCLRGAGGAGWKRAGLLAAMAGFSIYVVNIFSKGYLGGNLGSLAIATQIHSTTDRLALYQSSLQILWDHFWAGIGLGTFYFTYPSYRQPIDMSDGYFVHMDPLQFGLEMGIAALLLFYVMLIAILWRTIRAMRATPKDSPLRVEIMAPFCALLAVAIHTHIDFHLYILATLLAMAVPLAWWYMATEEALGEGRYHVRAPQGPLWIKRVALLTGMILIVNWPVRAAISAGQFPAIQDVMAAGRVAEMEEALERMAAYAPRNNYRMHQYFGRLYVWKLYEEYQSLTREEAMELFHKAEAAFARAIHYNRDFSGLRTDRARLYFTAQGWLIEDGFQRAQEDLEYVTAHNPLDWDARIGLVNAYQAQGAHQKALALLQQGRQWPMPLGPMGLRLLILESELYLKLGDRAGYDALQAQAREFAEKNGFVLPPVAPAP